MNTTNPYLRKASEDDLPFLMRLRRATMTEHLEAMGLFLSEVEHLERIRERFDCAHVVMDAARRIGMLKYSETARSIKIFQLQILPSLQGTGIGSSLVRSLTEEAGATGKRLSLEVLKANPARKLYERLGFTVVGEDKYQFQMEFAAIQLQSG